MEFVLSGLAEQAAEAAALAASAAAGSAAAGQEEGSDGGEAGASGSARGAEAGARENAGKVGRASTWRDLTVRVKEGSGSPEAARGGQAPPALVAEAPPAPPPPGVSAEAVEAALQCLMAFFLRPLPSLQRTLAALLPPLDSVRAARGGVVGVQFRSGHADWDFERSGEARPPGGAGARWTVRAGWDALDAAFALCPREGVRETADDADVATLVPAGVCYRPVAGGSFERAVLSSGASCAAVILPANTTLPPVEEDLALHDPTGLAEAAAGLPAGFEAAEAVPRNGTVSGLLLCGTSAARAFALVSRGEAEPWEASLGESGADGMTGDAPAAPLAAAPAKAAGAPRPWLVVMVSDLAAVPFLASRSPVPRGGQILTSRGVGALLHVSTSASKDCASAPAAAAVSAAAGVAPLNGTVRHCEPPGALRTFVDMWLLSICDGFVRCPQSRLCPAPPPICPASQRPGCRAQRHVLSVLAPHTAESAASPRRAALASGGHLGLNFQTRRGPAGWARADTGPQLGRGPQRGLLGAVPAERQDTGALPVPFRRRLGFGLGGEWDDEGGGGGRCWQRGRGEGVPGEQGAAAADHHRAGRRRRVRRLAAARPRDD